AAQGPPPHPADPRVEAAEGRGEAAPLRRQARPPRPGFRLIGPATESTPDGRPYALPAEDHQAILQESRLDPAAAPLGDDHRDLPGRGEEGRPALEEGRRSPP